MRRMMPVFFLIALLSPTAWADDDARAVQVSAATTEAFDHLRGEVLAASLGGDLTVGKLIARLDAGDQLDTLLQTAQQIGGTRWLDEQSVEVRLELHGDDLARLLQNLADKNPKNLPISAKNLRERLKKDFSRQVFSGIGGSTAANAADRLRPDPSQMPWRGVSDKDRVAAIDAARGNAVDRVLDSLRTVEWGNGRHLADALAVPAMHDELRDWLLARPITSIEFRDDLEVRVSLAASAKDFWPALKSALEKQAAVSPPHDAKQWENLQRLVGMHMSPARGAAAAQGPAVAPMVVMPANAPAWASDPPMSEEGVSRAVGGSKLRTARVAEGMALTTLRARLAAIPLSRTLTLGQAAMKDPHMAAAMERAMSQARIDRVQYDTPEPGAVRVRVTLDPAAVWREISR